MFGDVAGCDVELTGSAAINTLVQLEGSAAVVSAIILDHGSVPAITQPLKIIS
jgi:hypothetical protein